MLPRSLLRRPSVSSTRGYWTNTSVSNSSGQYISGSVSTNSVSQNRRDSISTRPNLELVRSAYPNTIRGKIFSEFAMEKTKDSVYISPIYTPRSAPKKKRGKKK